MTQNKSYNCKNICPVYLKNKISTENINSINIARIIKNACLPTFHICLLKKNRFWDGWTKIVKTGSNLSKKIQFLWKKWTS